MVIFEFEGHFAAISLWAIVKELFSNQAYVVLCTYTFRIITQFLAAKIQ